MKIVTLTLNPAFDVHCFCDNFRPYHESIAKVTAKDAGGKGVNISRALSKNGVENLAVVIVGKENGVEFCQALEKDGLTISTVWTDGRIRENITLHENQNPETRISFQGFSCEIGILAQVEERVDEVDEDTIIAFTGSIPKGITAKDVLQLLQGFRNKGAKIVIDSRSVTLSELLDFKPWLIKPNKDEAEAYAGKRIETVNDAVEIARGFCEKGIENILISLGGDGAVLVDKSQTIVAKNPSIEVRSTIGAGDAYFFSLTKSCARGILGIYIFQKKRFFEYGIERRV
jgi:1-phosphofructokinase family hexose kinase